MPIAKAPWLERSGRFSPLKTAVFAALFVPALASVVQLADGAYAANPIKEVLHDLGLWTVRLLLLSLVVTPAMQIFRYPRLLVVRRMIGVAAFAYVIAHFLFYVLQQNFDLAKVASEIVLRFYLTIGMIALLLLAVLASTSTDAMLRRLGSKNWTLLHRLVYLIAALGLVHYFIQAKLDIFEPSVMAGIFVWLMLYRAVFWTAGIRRAASLPVLAVLALAAAALTMAGEALGYTLFTSIDGWRVFDANFRFYELRPGWYVLIFGVAVLGAAAVKQYLFPQMKRAQAKT